ncbi:MAG: patatin-like phospholipase family protein [Candidatus Nitrospinota bacterium M3_3B_026]
MTARPLRLGLALGSGSARGWSHIGVIRALQEEGIEPDVVAGSSIGALVGAVYLSGGLDAFEEWLRALTWKEILHYLDVGLVGGGMIQGDKLMKMLGRYIKDVRVEDLPKRLGAVATDLGSGRETWLKEGPLLRAVRASIAMPGLFTPVKLDGQWLVDGGLVNPAPVSLCRALGAEVVIAVNLNADIVGGRRPRFAPRLGAGKKQGRAPDPETLSGLTERLKNDLKERADALLDQLFAPERDTPGLFETAAKSIHIMQDRITRSRMAGDPPEVIIAPRLLQIGLMEFDRAEEAIDGGIEAARRAMPDIKQALGRG